MAGWNFAAICRPMNPDFIYDLAETVRVAATAPENMQPEETGSHLNILRGQGNGVTSKHFDLGTGQKFEGQERGHQERGHI